MKRPSDNREKLIATTVAGVAAPARLHAETLAYDEEGRLSILPGTGGTSLGVHVGDLVHKYVADHLMVGLIVESDASRPAEPGAMHLLSCVGNNVRDARGEPLGVVAGKRGGIAPGFLPPCLMSVEVADHRSTQSLAGDRIIVEALGRGLELVGWSDVTLSNVSPRLLDSMPIVEHDRFLEVGVRAVVPSTAAGSGLGSDPWIGDLDIATPEVVSGDLAALRFGDLVAFDSIDGRVTRFFRSGFVSVGLVAHGPSPAPGHGIGITILLSGPEDQIRLRLDPDASVGPQLRQWAESL